MGTTGATKVSTSGSAIGKRDGLSDRERSLERPQLSDHGTQGLELSDAISYGAVRHISRLCRCQRDRISE